MSVATPIRILSEHARWLAVDKAAGMTVIPARDEEAALAVRQRLEAQLGAPLWVVHRIDRDTSGVLLFARDADAHRELNHAFEHGLVHKTYLAWTAGVPNPPSGRIDLALHSARRGKMRPAEIDEPGAKEARTDYRVEAQRAFADGAIARIRCHPRSGRQHQIRVHLRSLSCPILHDALYGSSTLKPPWSELPLTRMALHAVRLELPALFGDAAQAIEAPLAADLQGIEEWLRGA
jgi:tRNA pseudouridine32 synthase/23S rRNA pseudouridine746 synthase